MPNQKQVEQMQSGKGFIAALDQSGGSTPKALMLYGVNEDAYKNDAEMYDMIHAMRSRIAMAPAFTGERVLGAILFEMTMDREIYGMPSAKFLWEERGVVPFKDFMYKNVRQQDLKLFSDLNGDDAYDTLEDVPLQVIIPAFMISELRRAFEIGFMLFLPFLIIDLVTASILMSMGMMMLPPVTISLPFKIIFFVLVDGWYLITGSLVQSFTTLPPGG